MKKYIALLLALMLLAVCFAGCVASNPADDTQGTTENTTEAAADDTTGGTEEVPEGSDLAYVLANGKLVVGITEYEPMDYKDENGEWTGFDAELARLFAKELGVECEFFVLGDWGKKFFELEAKNIDCVWNGMTITDEAKANSSVSDPYVINAQVVVMKADRVTDYLDAIGMKELTVAVEEGSAGQAVAEENKLKTVAKQDQAGALLEVASGTADACVIDITMANAMTGKGTDYADLQQGITLSEEQYGVSFRKESNLTAKLNQFLKELKADGTLQKLAEKYELTLAE